MALSPYTPGSVARSVPGRATALAEYREAAQRIDRLDQFIPRIHVVHGPRGIGKTSLLRQGQRVFEESRVSTIWVTANPAESLLHSLLSELAKLVGTGTRIRKRAVAEIESISLELGNAVIGKVSATVRPNHDVSRTSSARLIEAIRIVLDAVGSGGGAGLAILIDEIQEADAAGLRTLAYAWQELAPAAAKDGATKAALFAVGLPGAPAHLNRAVSFSERFSFERLPGLDDAGAEEALLAPATELGVRWEDDALAEGIAAAQGYPYWVQLVGDAAWRAGSQRVGRAGMESGDRIICDDVRAGSHRVAEQKRTLYRARWDNASPRQREMLIAIAGLGGEDVPRGLLAAALHTETTAISVARQSLLDKGILEANQHGLLSFTVPGFTEFVLTRAGDE